MSKQLEITFIECKILMFFKCKRTTASGNQSDQRHHPSIQSNSSQSSSLGIPTIWCSLPSLVSLIPLPEQNQAGQREERAPAAENKPQP